MSWHVIGASGYIGEKLISNIPEEIPLRTYSSSGKCDEVLDLRTAEEINYDFISERDYVVILAAISSPDVCANQYELAYAVNVTGTAKVIKESLLRGANVLFISSDTVIGATDVAKDENSSAQPFGIYGQMKYEIEQMFRGHNRFKIFRLSYVFSKRDKFMQYLVNCNKGGTRAEVFDTLFRNVIYINDVVSAIIELGENFDKYSFDVVHLAGNRLISRKDIANIYQRIVAPELRLEVIEPPVGFFQARPPCIEIKSNYLVQLLKRDVISIEEAMQKEFS